MIRQERNVYVCRVMCFFSLSCVMVVRPVLMSLVLEVRELRGRSLGPCLRRARLNLLTTQGSAGPRRSNTSAST